MKKITLLAMTTVLALATTSVFAQSTETTSSQVKPSTPSTVVEKATPVTTVQKSGKNIAAHKAHELEHQHFNPEHNTYIYVDGNNMKSIHRYHMIQQNCMKKSYKNLNLTLQQRNEIKKLRADFMHQQHQIPLKNIQQQIHTLITNNKFDEKAAKSLADAMTQKQMNFIKLNHDIYNTLTPTQKEKYDQRYHHCERKSNMHYPASQH